jgi:hypothetical protein
MNKAKINYGIDIALAISFLACFATGIFKWPGFYNIIGTEIYRSVSMQKISRLHDWSGLIMGLLVFLHLILHWNWIVCMTKGIFRRK